MSRKKYQENLQNHTIIFRTSRLSAREWCPADAENLFLLNSDPEVIRYTGDKPFNSITEARDFIENYSDYRLHGFGRWALSLAKNNAFIGWCGLKNHGGDWVDLGFRLIKSYWGQGYATEAAQASLRVGFLDFGLPQIIGRAAVANTASIRVLEKINMKFWKRDSCEGIANAVYYRISREDYLSSVDQR